MRIVNISERAGKLIDPERFESMLESDTFVFTRPLIAFGYRDESGVEYLDIYHEDDEIEYDGGDDDDGEPVPVPEKSGNLKVVGI